MRYRLMIDFDLDPPAGTLTTAMQEFLPPSVENKAVAIAISDGRTIEVIKDREATSDLMTCALAGDGTLMQMARLMQMTKAISEVNEG